MHIPGGFIDNLTCVWTSSLAIGALGVAAVRLRKNQKSEAHQHISAVAVAGTGAGIFALQMLNFPISATVSGHVLGGALAAIALGPWLGIYCMASVLLVQCVLFGDGGLDALGANVLNMAVVGCSVGHLVHSRLLRRTTFASTVLAGSFAAWASVLAASLLCAVELALSGTAGSWELLSNLLASHAVIGLGEALCTAIALVVILQLSKSSVGLPWRASAKVAISAGMLAMLLLTPLRATTPDGLEAASEQLGFAHLARLPDFALMPSYMVAAIPSTWFSSLVAGLLGIVTMWALGHLLGKSLRTHSLK